MDNDRLNILQVNTADRPGGAERVAWNLLREYRRRSHGSWLAVGRKQSHDANVRVLRHDTTGGRWQRFWWSVHHESQPIYGRVPGARFLCRVAHQMAAPTGWQESRRGVENFDYPGSEGLLDLAEHGPDIVHGHNLHGNYFDLRALPQLCRRVPVVLTLHDAWLLSGHCAHSMNCQRWQTGCGQCPDLSLYPAVRRDATAENWRRKRAILSECRLRVATPSRWLMDKVERSIVSPAIVEGRVIPNGVDRSVFHPADAGTVRSRLGVPADAFVALFTACGIRRNPWKDFATLRAAMERVASRNRNRKLLFIALGERGPRERIGGADVRFVSHVIKSAEVAAYYQAADVYIHAARADTFPNSVIEALACGTPVAATAVGGIPEQVRSISDVAEAAAQAPSAGRPTGFLTPPGDAAAMAMAIERLLCDERLRLRLGANAAADAATRFGLRQQADTYLSWYRRIFAERHRPAVPRPQPSPPADAPPPYGANNTMTIAGRSGRLTAPSPLKSP
ncbi:MAG: glycosyltransferase [Phycisphaerae bacterium]